MQVGQPGGRQGGRAHAAAKPPMPPKQKIAVLGAAAVVVVGAAGFGAYSLVGGEGGVAAGPSAEPVETGPPTAAEVRTTTREFLTAWSAGRTRAAAKLTDDPAAARAGLTAYHDAAYVSKVNFRPGRGTGAKVPFKVSATVSYHKASAPWSYSSALTVVRDKKTGKTLVDWRPSVLHPKLTDDKKLVTGEAEAPPVKALDRNGKAIDPKAYPSLTTVLAGLRERYGTESGGTRSIETWIEDTRAGKKDAKAKAQASPPQTLLVLAKGRPGTVKTTIDPAVQRTAEAEVAKTQKAAMVVVKPSTGEILAVANKPSDGFDTALQGSYAPGSTMKVITSSMLIDKDLAHSGKEHPCPKTKSYGGWTFHNADDMVLPKGSTFAQSFANSCNTAFISMAEKLHDDDLTKEARTYFGIGQTWSVGVTTFDGTVPVQQDAQMAASLIGQGGVRMNPMTMASVAATIRTGSFHQPYLVSPDVDGRTLAKASPMKPGTVDEVRGMMKQTAQWGTGAKAMSGLSGFIGAKTGSAEVGGQKKPNAWFTAYRNDIAAAAVVPASGHGGDFAGPLVRGVLAAHG